MIRSNQSGARHNVDRSVLRSRPHRTYQPYNYMANNEHNQWGTSATKYQAYKEQKQQVPNEVQREVKQHEVAVSDFNKESEPLREKSQNLSTQEFTLKRQYDSDNIHMPLRLSYKKAQLTPTVQQRRHSTFVNTIRTQREEEPMPNATATEQFTIHRKNQSPPKIRRPSLPPAHFEQTEGIDMSKLWEKVDEKPNNWRNYKQKTRTIKDEEQVSARFTELRSSPEPEPAPTTLTTKARDMTQFSGKLEAPKMTSHISKMPSEVGAQEVSLKLRRISDFNDQINDRIKSIIQCFESIKHKY